MIMSKQAYKLQYVTKNSRWDGVYHFIVVFILLLQVKKMFQIVNSWRSCKKKEEEEEELEINFIMVGR